MAVCFPRPTRFGRAKPDDKARSLLGRLDNCLMAPVGVSLADAA